MIENSKRDDLNTCIIRGRMLLWLKDFEVTCFVILLLNGFCSILINFALQPYWSRGSGVCRVGQLFRHIGPDRRHSTQITFYRDIHSPILLISRLFLYYRSLIMPGRLIWCRVLVQVCSAQYQSQPPTHNKLKIKPRHDPILQYTSGDPTHNRCCEFKT